VAKQSFDDLPDSGYVRQADLIPAVLPFSASTFWRLVRASKLPKGVLLAPNITAWRVGDIREYLAAQAERARTEASDRDEPPRARPGTVSKSKSLQQTS